MVSPEINTRSGDGDQFASYMYGMEMHGVPNEPQNAGAGDVIFENVLIPYEISHFPAHDNNKLANPACTNPLIMLGQPPILKMENTSQFTPSVAIPIVQGKKSPTQAGNKTGIGTTDNYTLRSSETCDNTYGNSSNFSMSAERLVYASYSKARQEGRAQSIPCDTVASFNPAFQRKIPTTEELNFPAFVSPPSLGNSPRSLNESLFSFRTLYCGTTEHLEKQKRRRENHNAVERRRRDLINGMISQLTLLVSATPNSSDTLNPNKMNKGEVLEAAVRRILQLNQLILDLANQIASYNQNDEVLRKNRGLFETLITNLPAMEFPDGQEPSSSNTRDLEIVYNPEP